MLVNGVDTLQPCESIPKCDRLIFLFFSFLYFVVLGWFGFKAIQFCLINELTSYPELLKQPPALYEYLYLL